MQTDGFNAADLPQETDINFTPAGPSTCGGTVCGDGQECCFADGTCFDPSDGSACRVDPALRAPDGPIPCGSNRDCADDEICHLWNACEGPGYCVAKNECGACEGDGDGSGCEVCGCDGNTYPNKQTACYFGVRARQDTKGCGQTVLLGVGGSVGPDDALEVTSCGNDDHCPADQSCCTLLGECLDSAVPYLCGEPPEGADRRCTEDGHCLYEAYCKKDGCGTDVEGGCVSPRPCDAEELIPVCGCNGTTYTNAACAESAGTNVQHMGEC